MALLLIMEDQKQKGREDIKEDWVGRGVSVEDREVKETSEEGEPYEYRKKPRSMDLTGR